MQKTNSFKGEKMEKTKEKKATAEQFVEVLQELLRENVVGFIAKREDEGFSFCLAGGQRFSIYVEEV